MRESIVMESIAIARKCMREPIPEIVDAARLLDDAATAHLLGRRDLAEDLLRLADMPVLRDYSESLWGSKSPHVQYRVIADAPPSLSHDQRVKVRMPNSAEKVALYRRDGYHCRFCGIPVIRREVRKCIKSVYPVAVPWGSKNVEQHAAFQLMWAQYDHVLPHARGGTNDLDNVVISCAPCNFGRMSYTLEEVGVLDPRTRAPVHSDWDGLERFH
jgi:5-methylcytosine-specific restriction endonuclease McrA